MPKSHLYRSRTNRMIAGVAGGLAEYFEVDVALVRLLWILAFFFGGTGLLAYIIAWIIIPESKIESSNTATSTENITAAPAAPTEATTTNSENRRHRLTVIGLILIGFGVLFILKQFIPWNIFHYFWPALLIIAGVFILVKR